MTQLPGGHEDRESYRAFDDATEEDFVSAKTNRRLWFVFVAIACFIFEVTANPALALAFGCLKIGWGDFHRAHRLKKDDPSRIRGKVCARFSTAWGLIKVSLSAACLMFVVVAIQEQLAGRAGNPQAPAGPGREPPAVLMTAVLLMMGGLGLSALVSSFAVISALRHGLKVWVGAGENRAILVLANAILTWVTVGGIVLILVALNTCQKAEPISVLFFMVFALLALPVAILVLLEALERRVVAATPLECWGELPPHLLKASEPDAWGWQETADHDSGSYGQNW